MTGRSSGWSESGPRVWSADSGSRRPVRDRIRTRQGHGIIRTIEKLFGTSPFRLLVEHTRRVHETVELIRPLLEAYLEEDWDRCEELHDENTGDLLRMMRARQ